MLWHDGMIFFKNKEHGGRSVGVQPDPGSVGLFGSVGHESGSDGSESRSPESARFYPPTPLGYGRRKAVATYAAITNATTVKPTRSPIPSVPACGDPSLESARGGSGTVGM